MWLKVDHDQHPRSSTTSILQIEQEIFDSCIERGVLVARGSWFLTEKDKPLPGLYFRATFASASAESMHQAIARFGEAVSESFARK
jgi:aromatic amino acid aminotransferase I